jgi:mRNA interferase MazF
MIRGEIYYVDLGIGEGSEQSGLRPAVIIQNNSGNVHSPTVIVAVITTADKPNIPTHLKINLRGESTILCEQIRTISKSRVRNKIGELNRKEMKSLDRKLKISLGLAGVK